jgi:ABC-2 type transport system permease protein
VVNSYFNVLVQYGDQYQILDFQDLIEVKQKGGGAPEVELRNPEYELTRSIKKVQAGFQGGGDLLASLPRPVTLTGYVSADARLPDFLRTFKGVVTKVAGELRERSNNKLAVELVDPDADGGALAAKLEADYGLRPMQAGLLDARRFWFYLTLADGETTVQVPLPEDLDEAGLRRNLEAGLKRFTRGYLKTVALAVPAAPDNPYLAQMGMNDGPHFELLRQYLESGYKIKQADLAAGMVPEEADILLVAAPEQLTDKALFAMDQFLMKGGTVVLATAPFKVSLGRDLSATPQDAGLTDWLAHLGLTVEQRMVFDERNRPFPVPVNRQVGGFTLQEIQLVPYACFLDVRDDGLNPQLPVTAGLSQVLFNWAAPVQVDDGVRQAKKVTWLLKSSPAAWTADGTGIVPDFNLYGRLGFARGDDAGEKLLAVAVQGRFDSWFKGKPSPLLNGDDDGDGQGTKGAKTPQLVSVIDRSPESARLVLFASNDFISDRALQLSAAVAGHQDLSALQLVANTLDWALEDGDLPAIRGRGRYARTLRPLERRAQLTWEYLNYGLAAGGLLLVFIAYRLMSRRTRQRYQQLLDEGGR